VAKIVLGMNGYGGGHAQVEDQQGHCDRENAIAEGSDTFNALSGNTIVERWHRKGV
jgi:hypothetical protein